MRLIDADEFMENLIHCNGLGRRGLEAVLKTIKEQPTAYNVDNVVAELEELPNREADYYYAHSNDVIDRENAIDIVRKGGVE